MSETNRRMRAGGLSAVVALLAVAQLGVAQRLEVVSPLGEQAGREALEAAAEARQVYSELGLTLRKPHLPTLIVLLPTVADLAPYLGASVGRSRAVSFAGADRNYILVAWAVPGSPLRAVAHEYAHLVDPLTDAPVWFREGFAEYLSYCRRDGAGHVEAIAPARHLAQLATAPWLPLEQLREATRGSPAFESPSFYAQSWLAVYWLVAQGRPARAVRPADLAEARAALGSDGVTAALRGSFEHMVAPTPDEGERPWIAAPAPTSNWRVELSLAEADRELGRWDRAQATLDSIELAHRDDPEVAAARGALALDAGRYDEAERLLLRAADDPAASARTHYRLALMLLRPEAGPTRDRARAAAGQARLALEQFPAAPDYRLALAQALMVDERWEAAAKELNRLAAEPDWRGRAEEEMAELLRRRQQALSAVERPPLERKPEASPVPVEPLEVANVPAPPEPPPPAPMRWPPPGTSIAVGRIDFVDCRGEEKVIVLRHPLLRLRFRERKGRPAKLFLPPYKDWTEIPCHARDWTVNIAYYRYRGIAGITGEAVAILF